MSTHEPRNVQVGQSDRPTGFSPISCWRAGHARVSAERHARGEERIGRARAFPGGRSGLDILPPSRLVMSFAFSPTPHHPRHTFPARLDGRQGRALRETAASSRWIRTPPRRRSAPRNPPARSSVSPRPRALRPRGDHPVLPRHLPVRPRGPTDRAAAPVRSVAEHVPVANLRAPDSGRPATGTRSVGLRPPSRRAVRVSRTSPDAFDEARRTRN